MVQVCAMINKEKEGEISEASKELRVMSIG